MTSPLVISGAGPAGLAAALTIASAGGHPVVYERQRDVGGRFHGDFQGIENWTTQQDALEELAALGIEPTFEVTPFREAMFYDPTGREYRYRSPRPLFYLVRRGPEPGSLDWGLKQQARARGVEIRFNQSRNRLPEGGIVAQGPRGADAIAIGFVFETDMADGAFAVFSDRLAPKGYSYLLIHRGRGTVASCLFRDFHREKIYRERTIAFFRQTVGLTMKNERHFGGTGNFVYPPTGRRGRLLFVGEAAGFQDPLWGFGLRYAMLSGHLAALSLLEGHPERYDARWKKRLGGLMRSAMVNRYLYQRLGDDGYVRLMRRLGPDDDAGVWLRARYAWTPWKWLLFPMAKAAIRSNRREKICVREGCDCTWCHCHRTLDIEGKKRR